MMEVSHLQQLAVEALEDIKGEDILVFRGGHLTALFDVLIIASGNSSRQVKALARSVQEKAGAVGEGVLGVEGEETGDWVLVDLGAVVVHIMQPAVRKYYDLESLFGAQSPKEMKSHNQNHPQAILLQ